MKFNMLLFVSLKKESFFQNFSDDQNRVLGADFGIFCRTVLLRTQGSSLVPKSHDIQAWVKHFEEVLKPDAGITAAMVAKLQFYRNRFTRLAVLPACKNLVFFLKIIILEMFSLHSLIRSICHSL